MQQAASPNESIHVGHRQRLKEQFLEHGLDTLADVNVLELVLYYAIPRQDTNLIAHRLLSVFGSLSGVFDASTDDLVNRGGLTQNTATLLKLIPAAARRYQISRMEPGRILDTTQKCGERLVPFFLDETVECVYMLILDAKCKELGCVRLSEGSITETSLPLRKLTEVALTMKAASIVLAHNHASGIAIPSHEDVEATHRVASVLAQLSISLADHIVVAGDDFVSMAESGLLYPQAPSSPA